MSFEKPPTPKTGLPERKKLGELMTQEQKALLVRKIGVMLREIGLSNADWCTIEHGRKPIPVGEVFERLHQDNMLWKEFILELTGITEDEFRRLEGIE